jgi:hypothetical protein
MKRPAGQGLVGIWVFCKGGYAMRENENNISTGWATLHQSVFLVMGTKDILLGNREYIGALLNSLSELV